MRKYSSALLVPVVAVIVAGCAGNVHCVRLSPMVDKNERDGAIPYYQPKPYLLVAKNLKPVPPAPEPPAPEPPKKEEKGENSQVTALAKKSVTPGEERDEFSYRLIYLPDMTRKYGIEFERGFGTFDGSITLVDGWKLTGINLKTDSKTAETITAVGSALKDTAELVCKIGALRDSGATNTTAGATMFQMLSRALPDVIQKESQQPRAELWLYELCVTETNIYYRKVMHWPEP